MRIYALCSTQASPLCCLPGYSSASVFTLCCNHSRLFIYCKNKTKSSKLTSLQTPVIWWEGNTLSGSQEALGAALHLKISYGKYFYWFKTRVAYCSLKESWVGHSLQSTLIPLVWITTIKMTRMFSMLTCFWAHRVKNLQVFSVWVLCPHKT